MAQQRAALCAGHKGGGDGEELVRGVDQVIHQVHQCRVRERAQRDLPRPAGATGLSTPERFCWKTAEEALDTSGYCLYAAYA